MTPEQELIIKKITAVAQDLKESFLQKAVRAQDKYDYYKADISVGDFGIAMPKSLRNIRPGVGWIGRAVNTINNRVVFDGFASDRHGLNIDFNELNAITIINRAKKDSVIAGVSFIATIKDSNGKINFLPFTATEATGTYNYKTGLLDNGFAVLNWREYSGVENKYEPVDYIVFDKNYTAYFVNKELAEVIPNNTGRCLLQPLTHKSSGDQPLGQSTITKTTRRIVREVSRLKKRLEVAQEFYSTPQRYLNGIAEGAEKDSNLDSAIGKVWAINKDEDGEKPEIGQLAQMSMSQFTEIKKDYARDFCAETGLTLRNLGYETNTPSTAESLAAMSDDMNLEAVAFQTELAEEIKQLAITYYMLKNEISEVPSGMQELKVVWKPMYTVNVAQVGDALNKLFQIMPELHGTAIPYRMLGMDNKEIEDIQAKLNANQAKNIMGDQING